MNCDAQSYRKNSSEPLDTINQWINSLRQLTGKYLEQQLERAEGLKASRHLSRLDDRMLKDIGLIRADVERVALSQAPEKSLAELEMRKHRRAR
ncbi:MAG: DUF1127 domain-containing protein [Methyloligellaceae bacterium]